MADKLANISVVLQGGRGFTENTLSSNMKATVAGGCRQQAFLDAYWNAHQSPWWVQLHYLIVQIHLPKQSERNPRHDSLSIEVKRHERFWNSIAQQPRQVMSSCIMNVWRVFSHFGFNKRASSVPEALLPLLSKRCAYLKGNSIHVVLINFT